MPSYSPKQIKRLLSNPKAHILLSKCIQKIYKDMDYFEKREMDQLSKIIETNLKKKRGMNAGQYTMGELSYAELGIRLAILMMEMNVDEEGLKNWIQERKNEKQKTI